ncbi:MAG: hypothetical protein IT364_01615 [Candidatus Hydrogenedentes bacterium]|nr:hypothetical protein [Candidatus Hydrogenedentota bacterium]
MFRWTEILATWCLLSASASPPDSLVIDPLSEEALLKRIHSIAVVDFEDITPGEGLLLERARHTFEMYKAYTREHVLTLNYSNQPGDKVFPGDTIGRYILSCSLLSRGLGAPGLLSRSRNAGSSYSSS